MNAFACGFINGIILTACICGYIYFRRRLSRVDPHSGSTGSDNGTAARDNNRAQDLEQRADDLSKRTTERLESAESANTEAKQLIKKAKDILSNIDGNNNNLGDTNMISTSKKRYEGIQSQLLSCGTNGCLFLSLLSIIEEVNREPVDLIDAIHVCLEKGFIKDDFYCKDSIGILEHFTGKTWMRREVPTLPQIDFHDYTVVNYYNDRTKITHRRRRGFDTLTSSTTVREGYVKSYYVYTWR